MSMRLLIVDDHANTRALIKKFLAMPGIVFQECGSGEEAIACAREFKPHWITMDVRLPGLDGFESTKILKQEHTGARVIIVTAYNEPHFRELSRSVGATCLILKENMLALRLILEKEINPLIPSILDSHLEQAAP
jgi:CheY-like chemotaxis protein